METAPIKNPKLVGEFDAKWDEHQRKMGISSQGVSEASSSEKPKIINEKWIFSAEFFDQWMENNKRESNDENEKVSTNFHFLNETQYSSIDLNFILCVLRKVRSRHLDKLKDLRKVFEVEIKQVENRDELQFDVHLIVNKFLRAGEEETLKFKMNSSGEII